MERKIYLFQVCFTNFSCTFPVELEDVWFVGSKKIWHIILTSKQEYHKISKVLVCKGAVILYYRNECFRYNKMEQDNVFTVGGCI